MIYKVHCRHLLVTCPLFIRRSPPQTCKGKVTFRWADRKACPSDRQISRKKILLRQAEMICAIPLNLNEKANKQWIMTNSSGKCSFGSVIVAATLRVHNLIVTYYSLTESEVITRNLCPRPWCIDIKAEVWDFPVMTEQMRSISYLLYGLFIMGLSLRSIKTNNWSVDNLKNPSPEWVLPQVAQARNMSIGEHRHCCLAFKDLYEEKTYHFCNWGKWKDFKKGKAYLT